MKEKILLSDNSVSLSESIKFALARNGYEVDIVENEEQTIRMIKSGDYRLVIVDLKDMEAFGSGVINFLKQMKGTGVPTAVLALTQPSEREVISGIVSSGIKDWLMIPFSNEKLVSSVRRILG